MTPRRRLSAVGAVILSGAVVAGCGSSSSGSGGRSAGATTSATTTAGSSSTAGQDLKLTADAGGALKFDTTSLQAKAGRITITLSNPSSIPHGIALDGVGVDTTGSVVSNGGTSTVTATLKPGAYTFYCPVSGHRAAGMKGTLTVR